MASIILQALALFAAFGYARASWPIDTCAINKGTCDTDKYVLCGQNGGVIVQSLDANAFKKTNLGTCGTKPDDDKSLDAFDSALTVGKCFHTCTASTEGNKQQVFCAKPRGSDSWFPFQRKVPIPANTASAMRTDQFLEERLRKKFESLSECK